MAGMFGLIVSGRLVQTNFDAVAETRFVTTVADADNVNHVVIFLTGTHPFPEKLGGAVYFSWPSPEGAPVWHFLGVLTNQKPSAIFKISGLKSSSNSTDHQNAFTSAQLQKCTFDSQIGISVEPLSVISGLTPASNSTASTVSWQQEFGQSMCENLHNYTSSFARTINQLPTAGYGIQETFVPMSSVVNWYTNFTRKLQQNTNFWRK